MCLALGIHVFFPSALITPLYWVKMLRITVLEKDARVHTAKTVAGFGPGALDPKAFLLSRGSNDYSQRPYPSLVCKGQ